MPLYDYTCKKCGEQFEALVLKTLPAPHCPKCDSEKLEQMITRSFAVDSEASRESSKQSQIARNKAVRKDYAHAQAEYEKNHKH